MFKKQGFNGETIELPKTMEAAQKLIDRVHREYRAALRTIEKKIGRAYIRGGYTPEEMNGYDKELKSLEAKYRGEMDKLQRRLEAAFATPGGKQ